MLKLTDFAKREKNKIASTGVWLVLLEVLYQNETAFRLALNNENIIWQNNEYIAFPFEVGDISQNSEKELPTLELKVSNVNREVQSYLEQYQGGKNTKAIIRVVNTNLLSEGAVFEETFSVLSSKADQNWVTFSVGCDFSFYHRFPRTRYVANWCPYRYGDIECACVNSSFKTCNGTLSNCRERGNSKRFGGFAGISNLKSF